MSITFLHQVQNIEYINNILDSVFSLQICRRCQTLLSSWGGHIFDQFLNSQHLSIMTTAISSELGICSY